MKARKAWIQILILSFAMLLLVSCTANTSTEAAASEQVPERVFTLEELAGYNGQNGNPAYIAVDGVVYDVSKVPFWKGGKHNGYEAGKDLTEAIKSASPHGTSKLKGLPVVGKLQE